MSGTVPHGNRQKTMNMPYCEAVQIQAAAYFIGMLIGKQPAGANCEVKLFLRRMLGQKGQIVLSGRIAGDIDFLQISCSVGNRLNRCALPFMHF